MKKIIHTFPRFIAGVVFFVMTVGITAISTIFFATPKTAAVATYSYVVTNLKAWDAATDMKPASCPGGSDFTPSNLTAPGDTVTISGVGFSNRSISDNALEMLYLPINNALRMIYKGGDTYYGLHSWSDNAIEIEVAEGQGGALGSNIILRKYDTQNMTSSCAQGTLSIICDSSTYSDWGYCQPNGTQSRTILSSSPSGCYAINPTLSQSCAYTPPTCTAFTYSDWGICNNSQQTRSITSSSPNSCIGGIPILTQACTPSCTINDYSCSAWNSCSVDGTQTRTCTKNSNCIGGVSIPTNTQSCIYTPPICTSWTYSDWGICSANGQQTRTISGSSPTGCAGGSPSLSQACTPAPVGPKITSISPTSAYFNQDIDIIGIGFGNRTVIGDGISTNSGAIVAMDGQNEGKKLISWTDTKIRIRITNPNKLGTVLFEVATPEQGNSNKFQLQILATPSPDSTSVSAPQATSVPAITSISPSVIEKGTNVTLSGSKFMNLAPYAYGCANCKVLINGSEVVGIYSWNWKDDSISFTMPNTASNGYIQVQDSKGNMSNKFNFTIQSFATQNSMSITSITPTTIVPGDIVTINGNGFGTATDSASVMIGGVYLQKAVWSNTQIKVQFPSNGQFGQNVKVKRCKNQWSNSADDCVEAVSSETVSEKKYSNDQYSGLQWYLENVNAAKAWQISQGSSNIVVAVIDSGVDTNHEDLTHAIWLNQDEIENNGIDDDNNGYIDDRKGWNFVKNSPEMTVAFHHGTGVAGIIAAKKDNQIGISGIAPNVKIMSLTVLDENGNGSGANIKKAILYAIDNGAKIINLSLGGLGLTTDYDPDYDKIFQHAYDNNVLVVAAVGNGDILGQGSRGQNLDVNPNSPACNDGSKNLVVGVGATNENNQKTLWSNYGKCVDVWAPGESIVTTAPPPKNYDIYDGTSESAPIVSGIAALVKSQHSDWNVEEIKAVLMSSQTNGIIDAYKALTANKPNVVYQPLVGPGFVDTSKFKNESFQINPDIGKSKTPVGEKATSGSVFPDIAGYPSEEAIGYLKDKGIVKGYPDNTFRPENTLNRAELLKIVILAKYPEPTADYQKSCFKDIRGESWYAPYVCFAKGKNIIQGYPDGTFKPEQQITYTEALKIALETLGYTPTQQTTTWYQAYLNKASEIKVGLNGLSPGQQITRGGMAQLIMNIMKYSGNN